MKKFLSCILAASLVLPYCIPVQAAGVGRDEVFQPDVTYELSVTAEERNAIHDEVDAISGDVGDVIVNNGKYDPLSLVGAMLDGSDYDSISYGSRAEGVTIPTEYPFPISNAVGNRNELDRKTAKLAWVKQLAEDLGFPVVVQRQDDKYVYIEIGDPDAPEMVMALSHLDSPTGAVKPEQLERWRDPITGEIGTNPDAYHTTYVQDGWIYGTGIQDDSGPTLATLYAAKAMMEAGLPMDRRVRIVMGCYEDGSPGVPKVEDTLNYMDIPYYTGTPSFYDNWAYKSLNREETPVAGYTSDSRFPVVVGNSKAITPTIMMDLSEDAGKPFSLVAATAGVTLREGDETLKDIVYGSASQIASRAVFTLNAAGASAEEVSAFISCIEEAAAEQDWFPAVEGETPKMAVDYDAAENTIVLEINTDVAMEYPTPQYGKNAIVWGMYLISESLDGVAAELQLKKAADGLSDLFFRDCEEKESYIGKNMDIPEELLRNPENGVANLTFAFMGGINNEELTTFLTEENMLSVPMQIRSMHTNEADYECAMNAVVDAWHEKGFSWQVNGMEEGQYNAYSNPTLYASHDNPLIALQMASYKASIEDDPEAFSDVMDLMDMAYPVGTTGGTLASNYRNKMTAFGAVIPGNERWWHTANERMKVDSAIQMTKMMADGMLEMARYSGPAGAQYMWADIEGLNANRADLDLLDVTVNTYQDASDEVLSVYLGNDELLAATKFDIEMWNGRGDSSPTAAAFEAGHGEGGVYLSLDDPDFLENTFVLPMRLEFKISKSDEMTEDEWQAVKDGNFENINFNIVKDGKVVPLVVDNGQNANQFFSSRVSQYDPEAVYVSVNLAITDAAYEGVTTVLADSKTDLYDLNDEYLANHEDPFPERGEVEERGFFLFGDGEKNACFSSPDAIYVARTEPKIESPVELVFDYPEDVPADEVKLTVFDGIPQWIQKNSAKTVEGVVEALTNPSNEAFPKLNVIEPDENGKYIVNKAGGYCYFVRGKEPGQYYNIIKLFIVDAEDQANGIKTIPVKTAPSAGTGFETGNNNPVGVNGEVPKEGFDQGVQHLVPIEGTDEMEHLLGTDELVGYKPFTTPAFQEGRALYQATTQDEMMDFIAEYAEKSGYMHVYSAGKTEHYGFDYPVLVFTKKDIPDGATMEDAAQILKDGGLPIVWQQAQIHPYEPAAGESALVMIQELCGEYGENILDKIDIVMIPRVNVEGGFLFWRGDYNGTDMNRDHMVITSGETALLHETYNKFEPHVVVDNHEFFFSEMGNYNANPEQFLLNDFQITGATSLNDDPVVTDLTVNLVVDKMHKDLIDTGFRAYHYGITSNNPIGRAYYGLDNAISVLIESHGADGALFAMPRRVYGQVVATKSVFETTAENGKTIVDAVNSARADVAKKGATYEDEDILVLKQSASGAVTSPTPLHEYVADIYGNIDSLGANAIDLQDTIKRSRTRPTAYLVDASEPWVEELLYILDHHGAEYFKLDDGATVKLQQYYYISKDGAKSCIADLRDPKKVTFKDGAIMIPMDQECGTIIGMLMEPDVGDSSSYNGTLFQYGMITYDETTMNLPLYRYTGDNPRKALLDKKPSGGGSGSSGGSSSGGGTVVEKKLPFTDVKTNDWFYEAVKYAYEKELFSGTSTTKFSPDTAMTRAMLATVLYSMEGSPAVTGTSEFDDVAPGAWYHDAVLWAMQKGIVSGYSAKEFGSNDIVTREQMALILKQYANLKKYDTSASDSLDVFADADEISGWAENAVQWAVAEKLLSGKGNGVLDPASGATRAEVAQILMRFAEEAA